MRPDQIVANLNAVGRQPIKRSEPGDARERYRASREQLSGVGDKSAHSMVDLDAGGWQATTAKRTSPLLDDTGRS